MVPLTVLTSVLAVWFAFLGVGKAIGAAPMVERAAHVGFGLGVYRVIGALELAGVIGLLLGLMLPALGALAAAGFLLLLTGAVAAHLRAGDRLSAVVPAIVSALVVVGYLIALLR
ncbi:DoxX family protein [Streptomyces sp. NPDC051738]|uniref:DoxX family protein n=1 Tax=Streptomyces sp. NPDC051738 TaxID=3365672 RepID=UPI0037D3B8FE